MTKAVDFLKAAMIARPALALPQKGNYNYLVRTDALDFTIGVTLRHLQFLDGSKLDPVERIIAYYSRKLHDAETRYMSRRYTETSIIACRKRRYMGSLGGALEFAEGPTAQGYPAQWREEQIAWCGAWDTTLYTVW